MYTYMHMSPSRWDCILAWRGELLAPPAPHEKTGTDKQKHISKRYSGVEAWPRDPVGRAPVLAAGWPASPASSWRPSQSVQANI